LNLNQVMLAEEVRDGKGTPWRPPFDAHFPLPVWPQLERRDAFRHERDL